MSENRTARDIAVELEKTMRCTCDLDNWEATARTGHSIVCLIHKSALRIDAAGSWDKGTSE